MNFVTVLSKKRPIAEALSTGVAFVRHDAVFAHFVRAQLTRLRELPLAQIASVRFLISVDAHVALEVLASREALQTHDARQRLLRVSVLRARVRGQRVCLAKALTAHLALVRHPKMLLEVRREVAFVHEPLAAKVAPELWRPVDFQVAAQVTAASVAAAAHVAHERPLPPASTIPQLQVPPSDLLLINFLTLFCTSGATFASYKITLI
jgi:hypothetical protein